MEKFTIYQVLPHLFGNDNTTRKPNGRLQDNGSGKFSSFDVKTLKRIKALGITHIWYTGVLEHATQTDYSAYGMPADCPAVTKGIAGSPYAVRDYYDVCPDLADKVENRMQEFEALIKRTHSAGMKMLIDFVPNHVARHYYSDAKPLEVVDLGAEDNVNLHFSTKNNFYYLSEAVHIDGFDENPAKATGNDCFHAYPSRNDWYETVKLNYGIDYSGGGTRHFHPIPDTWYKMRDILLFWAGKGVDGFRCDMAEMVPVEFWQWATAEVKQAFQQVIFIAEVYNPQEYRNYLFTGGFDYLYDKVGLYDTLRNVMSGYQPAADITRCWQHLEGIGHKMLNFMENHDEQRIVSDFFAGNPQRAFPAILVSALMNTAPFMLYFGQELGEKGMDAEGFSGRDGRTSIFDYWCLESIRQWRNATTLEPEVVACQKFYQAVLSLSIGEDAIKNGAFYDLMYLNFNNENFDTNKQYAFFRYTDKEKILVVANFDSEAKEIALNISQEVFDFIGLQPATMIATELLTNQKLELTLSPTEATRILLPESGGVVLKF
jgi:glycosidase